MKKYKIISAIILSTIAISTVIAQTSTTTTENRKKFYSHDTTKSIEVKSEELEKTNYKITKNLKIPTDWLNINIAEYFGIKKTDAIFGEFIEDNPSLKYKIIKENEYITITNNGKEVWAHSDLPEGKYEVQIEICGKEEELPNVIFHHSSIAV